jgi:hypothetical protein
LTFGSFSERREGQRIGRNPKTGQEVPISQRRVLVFGPSQEFRHLAAVHLPTDQEGADHGADVVDEVLAHDHAGIPVDLDLNPVRSLAACSTSIVASVISGPIASPASTPILNSA